MKLNLFKRSMIFATFFGSCLCIALIVASLGTTHWIDARARRTSNPLESEGRISFGLFEGRKELNFGYGWRNHDFSGKETLLFSESNLSSLFIVAQATRNNVKFFKQSTSVTSTYNVFVKRTTYHNNIFTGDNVHIILNKQITIIFLAVSCKAKASVSFSH